MAKLRFLGDPTEPPEGRGREINGRRWHQAPGTQFTLRKYNYKKHLEEIKQNLEEGPGYFLESISEDTIHGGVTQPAIFGLIRMIMPSIETLARAKSIGPTTLLFILDVPAATFVWNLYRDMLTHNDEWVRAKVGKQNIKPATWITMSTSDGISNPHTIDLHNGIHALNVGSLYYDLIKYLDDEIGKAPPDKTIEIIDGIEYLEDAKNDEVQLILGEIRTTEKLQKGTDDWFERHMQMKLRQKTQPKPQKPDQ